MLHLELSSELLQNFSTIKKREFEYELKKGHYSLGFIDALISIDNWWSERTILKIPIKGCETWGQWTKRSYIKNTCFLIEIKPTVKSFGETLRQLNFYKNHFYQRDSCENEIIPKICLMTTKTQFKEAFEKQGIIVIETETQ